MKSDFAIVVAGAGVAGLTVATLLANGRHARSLNITVIDASPAPQYCVDADIALRVSAVSTGSAQLLESVGVWRHVTAARACPYDRMRVWDHTQPVDGPATIRFDAADFAVPQLGYIVEDLLLRDALARVLGAASVELRFEARIDGVEFTENTCHVRLDDGTRLDADVVIAADGANSRVRAIAGIRTSDYPYGQTALVSHVTPERPHQHTAWQRFLPDGPLGLLPLSDGRVSIVWSTSEANAANAYAASDTSLGRTLTAASDGALGLLTAAGSRAQFPLCARHANRYVQRHLALIGDAAHAIHPLAGQGANLGLRDAHALAQTINAALDHGEFPGDLPVLRRYERRQKGLNATMLHFMTGLNRLFTNDSALLRDLRTLGMRLFNYSGPIRARAVEVALGMSGRG